MPRPLVKKYKGIRWHIQIVISQIYARILRHVLLRITAILIERGYSSSHCDIVAEHLRSCSPAIGARQLCEVLCQSYALLALSVVLACLRPGRVCDFGYFRVVQVNDKARRGFNWWKWPNERRNWRRAARINEVDRTVPRVLIKIPATKEPQRILAQKTSCARIIVPGAVVP